MTQPTRSRKTATLTVLDGALIHSWFVNSTVSYLDIPKTQQTCTVDL